MSIFTRRGGETVPALDERKTAILNAIVQGYVHGGEPVGSRRLAEEWGLGVSPATVRTEMAALEDAGYITQPHTSAGRIPTDKGYRFFVDTIDETHEISPEQRAALEALLLGAADLEDLLRRTSQVLSRLTRFAALVSTPRLDRSRLRHIELVRLGPTSVLAVLIAETGRVEKRLIDLRSPLSEGEVARARQAVNEAAAGLRVAQAPDVIAGLSPGAPDELRPLLDAVADAVRQGLTGAPESDHVFLGGTARIAGEGYFDRLEEVKRIFETFEEQVILLKMLRDTLEGGDPAVRIGTELPLVELAACSVVAASYEAAGSAGSVGVIGPTRMDYPRTLAAVKAVASSLEKALAELTGGGS